jgi:hypothetical protein
MRLDVRSIAVVAALVATPAYGQTSPPVLGPVSDAASIVGSQRGHAVQSPLQAGLLYGADSLRGGRPPYGIDRSPASGPLQGFGPSLSPGPLQGMDRPAGGDAMPMTGTGPLQGAPPVVDGGRTGFGGPVLVPSALPADAWSVPRVTSLPAPPPQPPAAAPTPDIFRTSSPPSTLTIAPSPQAPGEPGPIAPPPALPPIPPTLNCAFGCGQLPVTQVIKPTCQANTSGCT